MKLKELLEKEGIIHNRIKQGEYSIECPKAYCKASRPADDSACLHLDITGVMSANWKCRNCLWTGAVGGKPLAAVPPARAVKTADEKAEAALQPSPYYGVDKINTSERHVILCQRESDADIVTRCGFLNVIALPAGAVGKDRFVIFTAHPEVFTRLGRVIIAFDSTQEGEALRQEVIRRVGAAKCWNVKFYRDTAAATLEQDGVDFVCGDINEATAQPIRGLYQVDEFMDEVLAYYDGGMAAGVGTGWENVDKLYTVLPGQFTVITGIPNSGKSTWLDALTVNLAQLHDWKFGVFSPENPKALHTIKLTQKRVGMPSDPKHKNRMSRETLISGAAWVREYFKFISSTVEPPTLEWILERATDAVLRYGIKGLVIDPWNRIVKKYESGQNESAYVEAALAQILRFCQNHDVHVWLVAHPAKQEPDKKTGIFPVPSLYSISGGANFPNMMDNGIVIYRPSGADNKHVTEFWARKIRFDHVGQTGHTNLKYDNETGQFSLLDTPAATYSYGTKSSVDDEPDDGIRVIEAIV